MTKWNDTTNGVTSFDEVLANNTRRELRNAVETAGIIISDSDFEQLAKSMANYSAVSTFYTDSGTADVYDLNPIDNFKGLTALIDGAEARFRAANLNTGASTINVAGTGVRGIKLPDGTTNPSAGDIPTTQDTNIRYNLGNNVWVLVFGSEATVTKIGNSLLPKQITISNNSGDSDHDIDFTAGNFIFSDGSGQTSVLALTKQIDNTFVVGTNQGGLDTGTVAADTTYHCFAIHNLTTNISDFLFSTNLASPTLPSGFTKKRRIGSIITDSSSNILPGSFTYFANGGYKFTFNASLNDRPQAASPTSPTLQALTVPGGIIVTALITADLKRNAGAGTQYALFVNPDYTATTPSATNYDNFVTPTVEDGNVISLQIETNISSQIIINATSSTPLMQIQTKGWIDYL